MPGSVIVAGARTPIGKMSGAFASLSAMDLGGFAIKAALERAGLTPEQVDYVFMGQVILAGTGQITDRHEEPGYLSFQVEGGTTLLIDTTPTPIPVPKGKKNN